MREGLASTRTGIVWTLIVTAPWEGPLRPFQMVEKAARESALQAASVAPKAAVNSTLSAQRYLASRAFTWAPLIGSTVTSSR